MKLAKLIKAVVSPLKGDDLAKLDAHLLEDIGMSPMRGRTTTIRIPAEHGVRLA